MHRGLARSRALARELIDGAHVHVDGTLVTKPARPVTESSVIEVDIEQPRWVSRAAAKLDGAFGVFAGLSSTGKRCLDVGASTGGFTQVLLERGAASVIALDVGHGQLVPEIAADSRVTELSGTSVRGLEAEAIGGVVDLLVADLSFISLRLVLGTFRTLLAPSGDSLVLVKPQFEVGRERLGRTGVVRSAEQREEVVLAVATEAMTRGFGLRGVATSPLRGGEGNTEFLLWLGPPDADGPSWESFRQTVHSLVEGGNP